MGTGKRKFVTKIRYRYTLHTEHMLLVLQAYCARSEKESASRYLSACL